MDARECLSADPAKKSLFLTTKVNHLGWASQTGKNRKVHFMWLAKCVKYRRVSFLTTKDQTLNSDQQRGVNQHN